MLETFAALSKLLRYRRLHIDGTVFRLHCTLTVIILMTFCLINSTKLLVGEPIDCESSGETVDKSTLNMYCFIGSTYSIDPDLYAADTDVGIYRGLGTHQSRQLIYHYYYQWVWFMLFMQSIFFYFPRWLWKCFEQNKMSALVSDLNYFSSDSQAIDRKVDLIVEYLYKTNGINDWYAMKYWFCEILSLLNVILQIVVNDMFLCHQFNDYGFRLFRHLTGDPTVKVDPMTKIFPILSKCEFKRFGATGSVETIDALCVLSVNIFNQKIYLFLWFWYYFLAIVTSFVVAFRLVIICCPQFRYYVCRHRFELCLDNSDNQINLLISRLYLGNWFILYLLTHNIEPIVSAKLLEKLCRKFQLNVDSNSSIVDIDNNNNNNNNKIVVDINNNQTSV
ncbi:innexin inx2-like [Oppia nitens]|uniref:innexin inx2-like n=1 Tax=Oppia nitens TaxID=1686743 RepID=UPI0023DB7660|nr:innexin inx2-like [Oppia nitens]